VTSTLLLAGALAALGLQVRVAELRSAGPRPLLLGLLASLMAAVVALALISMLHGLT